MVLALARHSLASARARCWRETPHRSIIESGASCQSHLLSEHWPSCANDIGDDNHDKQAEATHALAVATFTSLVNDFAAVPGYRHLLAKEHLNLGRFYGLCAACFVLAVLLAQNFITQARLSRLLAEQRREGHDRELHERPPGLRPLQRGAQGDPRRLLLLDRLDHGLVQDDEPGAPGGLPRGHEGARSQLDVDRIAAGRRVDGRLIEVPLRVR